VVVVVGTVLALAVGPWASVGDVLTGLVVYGTFGIPIVGLALRVVWNRSYPDPDD
jgi:curli biogenesis system outer membrane secretion channel CsgG